MFIRTTSVCFCKREGTLRSNSFDTKPKLLHVNGKLLKKNKKTQNKENLVNFCARVVVLKTAGQDLLHEIIYWQTVNTWFTSENIDLSGKTGETAFNGDVLSRRNLALHNQTHDRHESRLCKERQLQLFHFLCFGINFIEAQLQKVIIGRFWIKCTRIFDFSNVKV